MTHLEEEFDEAARTLVGSYRVVRRLAGHAIIERQSLQRKIDKVSALLAKQQEPWYDIIDLKNDLEDILDDEPPVV